MSLNGSGTAVINSAGQPVVATTLITAAAFNSLTADLATMISTCVMKDGQQTITQNIPFNDKKITGLAAASSRTDGASLATIQDGTGVYVATVAGTADAITLTPAPAITAYVAGQTFRFLASGANTGAVTVAISGLAAKAITKNGTVALVAGDIPTASMVTITYDGTRFILGTVASSQSLQLVGGTLTGALVGTTGTFSGAVTPQALLDISGASAGQVKFPAAQNASAESNTLDDYEEGNWTPSVGGTATYTIQTGRYTKIGRQVTVTCQLQINVLGTGSTFMVSGLPFTFIGTGSGAVYFTGSATSVTTITALLANTTDVVLYSLAAAGASMALNAIFANSTLVNFTVTYFV